MAQQPWPQSTIVEITDSEAAMVHTAEERFGEYYRNAWLTSVLLSRCVVSIDHTRMHFGRFLALAKKHHSLAVLSIVRLHKVQAMMNLRQTIEAGCAAAFAIAKPEGEHFFKIDEQGFVVSPQSSAPIASSRSTIPARWLTHRFSMSKTSTSSKPTFGWRQR
jgi:hypothetical protein